jgi:NADH dehydrogenase [ubiquinone] 1 alpha subcomplex assembly factor 3
VDRTRYESSLCIHQGRVTTPWEPQRVCDITPEHLQFLMEQPPEVLVIGTGRLTAFPQPEVLELLADTHIGFECMDSRAAARTYNILVEEGRTVSAVMLPPSARS